MKTLLSRLLLAGVSLLVASTTLSAALTVQPSRPGNLFLTTEPVEIPVRGGGGNVGWVVKNYFGETVAQGTDALVAGAAILRPNPSQTGYFDLFLTELNGGATVSTLKTRFAIVTPLDIAAMSDSPFGVQSHFAQATPTALAPLIARLGITQFRDEHYWTSIETARGIYNFPALFTGFMSQAASQSLVPLITLDWSNPFYDFSTGNYTAPHTAAGRQGYANYALQLLNRYGSQLGSVEVWNEYNGGTFVTGPATANKPFYYASMLQAVSTTIKPVRPDVRIVAGATIPVAHGFLRDVFAQGAMPYLDVVSVHAYGAAEGWDLEFSGLSDLIKSYNGGLPKPIWVTEFSMESTSEANRYEAAPYLVRIVTQMLTAGVERMYYYLLQDDSYFPFRGLVGKADGTAGDFLPNPPAPAYANLIRQLYRWTPAGRVPGLASTTYVYRFTKNGTDQYVCWSTAPTSLMITSTGPVSVVDIMGNQSAATGAAGQFTVTNVGADPFYLLGNLSAITETPNSVLADSTAGYSNTQGDNGWSYGYANLASNAPYQVQNFQPMAWGIWMSDNYRWLGTSQYLYMLDGVMHPSSAWAVRRWTSNATGLVKLTGSLARSTGGDGVGIRIFADGIEKLNLLLAPGQARTYEVANVPVVPGTKIDFAVTQLGENSFDATTFTSRITQVGQLPPPTPTPTPTPSRTSSTLGAPTSLTAWGVSDNSVQLNWNDNATAEQGFLIEWRWGAQPYTTVVQLPPNAVAYRHNENMPTGRVYTYRVRAYAAGQYSAGSNESSTTDGYPAPTGPPSATPAPTPTPTPTPTPAPTPTPTPIPNPLTAPTNLSAVGIADNSIQLNWTDNASDEQGYFIEWRWGTEPYVPVAQVPANTTSYRHNENMPRNRVYTYRVRAYTGTQFSVPSNEASSTDGG